MEMAGKLFSPFREMVVQPTVLQVMQLRLTNYVTASYGLWKWLCNYVLQPVQLCLTVCATASYGLWKWLASSFFHLWKRFYKWYERKSAVT
jgi:hypothetical protein